jgi:hypothetical protein
MKLVNILIAVCFVGKSTGILNYKLVFQKVDNIGETVTRYFKGILSFDIVCNSQKSGWMKTENLYVHNTNAIIEN